MKNILLLSALFSLSTAFSQNYNYNVDLENVTDDKVQIELSCSYKGSDTAWFSFPMTIPGTYAVLDYGRYISKMKAFDENEKHLKVIKKGNNSFAIIPGKTVAKITYTVDDSWEEKKKKTKIFEPAGTGFEKGEYFYINGGGLFGYFDKNWNSPVRIIFKTPADLKGYTTLESLKETGEAQAFMAKSYHELIDSPILFTSEKEENLKVGNTKVSVASYYKNSDSSAYLVKLKIDSAMQAIDKFVDGKLPVNHYAFLNYVADFRYVEPMMNGGKLGFFKTLKAYKQLSGQGFGALEHGHSSSYFLPDFGGNSYTDMLYETAIHEFMHIYTPLSLHSENIGNFDYSNPKMSQHLWLYEGVTEYFSVQISLQGKLSSVDRTLKSVLLNKIASSYRYPDSIPFTKMSANVFDKPYIDYYGQVYERGAIMAMLLDIRIMDLTDGKKTLKSVIMDLSKKYGAEKSFDEATFISEFVKASHPGMQEFFDRYVNGKEALPITDDFAKIGINYQKPESAMVPVPIGGKSYHTSATKREDGKTEVEVVSFKKTHYKGLKKGDKYILEEIRAVYRDKDGNYVPEGTPLTINLIRDGKIVPLAFTAKYEMGKTPYVMEVMETKSEKQQKLFDLWSTGK